MGCGRFLLLIACVAAVLTVGFASDRSPDVTPSAEFTYVLEDDLGYAAEDEGDAYARERCTLDLHRPDVDASPDARGYPTIVWFHGGGLTGGSKHVPEALANRGFAVAAVNYRLSPRVEARVCIEDAARAVAWVLGNIAERGGDPDRVFVSGHSAGGYLTSMVGLDARWLGAHDVDPNALAGLVPLSGHTITHFTVRAERGIPGTQPIVDDLAPLYHVRKDAPPLLLITGDRHKEMLGRYEENAYLARMMQVVGHDATTLYELDGYGHGMTEPAFPLVLEWARERCRELEAR